MFIVIWVWIVIWDGGNVFVGISIVYGYLCDVILGGGFVWFYDEIVVKIISGMIC